VPRPLGPTFHPRPVRDALGLVRMLFAVERDGTDLDRPAALVEIGNKLVLSLDLGRWRRDSLGHRAAVNHATEAVDRLAAMTWPGEVAEVVRIAQARVVGARLRKDDERDAKRKAVAARG
jgi:hypothetical protein